MRDSDFYLPVNTDDEYLAAWLRDLAEKAFTRGVIAGVFYGFVGTLTACVLFLP